MMALGGAETDDVMTGCVGVEGEGMEDEGGEPTGEGVAALVGDEEEREVEGVFFSW